MSLVDVVFFALPSGWPGTLLAIVIVAAGAIGLFVVIALALAALVLPREVFVPGPKRCPCCAGELEEEDEWE